MLHLEDIRFGNAGLWWILLLPLLLVPAYAWYWAFRRRVKASFSGRSLVGAMVQRASSGRIAAAAVCTFLALELVGVALLQPKYGLREVMVKGIGVDVCVVLDASRSMKVADVSPDRLTASTVEIGRLMDLMKGNRVALVPFAGLSFIQTPLTLDYEVVKAYMAGLHVSDIPVPGTALGRALKTSGSALGLDSTDSGGSTHKVVIVFTDGGNHEGKPVEVATELAAKGVRIYTVGVGTPAGQPIPIIDEDGQVTGTAREEDGKTPLISKLNEELLKELAEKTGGKYFALSGVGSVAGQLKAEVDAVQKAEYRSRVEKLLEDRFQYPLAAGLVLMLASMLLLGGRFGRSAAVVAILLGLATGQAHAKGIFEMDHSDVDSAIELYRQGRFGDAAKALEETEADLPARPDLLYDLALAKDAAGEHEAAVDALDRALGVVSQAGGEAPEGWPSQARLLHAKGTVLGHEALAADKGGKPPLEVRGIWRRAVEALTGAIMADPGSEDTRRNLELAAMAAYPSCRKLDDSREPNDSAEEAKFLEPDPNTMAVKEDLLLCPGNSDFFKLPVNPGETLIAGVVKPDEGGGDAQAPAGPAGTGPGPADVDLTLTDQDGGVVSPKGKQARFTAREQGTLVMGVTGPEREEEDGIPYVLDVRVIPPCPAGDDSMEDNDTRDSPKPVEDGQHSFRVCPSDDDWFAYTEKEGTQKQVSVQVPDGEGPLELEVFSADGSPLDVTTESGEKGTAHGVLFPKAEQDAPFFIRVFGGGGQGFYTLEIKDPSGGGGDQDKQPDEQPDQQPQQPEGSQTMRELLDSIDRNEENLEAEEASRNFPYRDYVPEKDW